MWPLGIDGVSSWTRAFSGRALWKTSFRSFIRIAARIVADARIVAFLFCFFV